MSNLILTAVIALGVVGLVLAVVLYVVSRKFAVETDPRVGQIQELLPGANCGGCGFPGCSAFAEACVKQGNLEGLKCTASKDGVMDSIGAILGAEVAHEEPKVAVVRCNGSCENRPRVNRYGGVQRCSIANMTAGGETGCFFGCLGCGDCVSACQFGAITMNPETGLPEVDEEKCTACGQCVKACPRHIIELRKKGKLNRRVYVSCVNKDKGPVARKACKVACIGCGKCVKVCPFEAITLENNVAYIDFEKCRMCKKCVAECPQGAILAVNFPVPKPKPAETAAPAAKPAAAPSEKPATAPTPEPVPVKPAQPAATSAVKAEKSESATSKSE